VSDQSNTNGVSSAAGTNLPQTIGATPVQQNPADDFIGEFAVMDLTPLKDKLYMVSVGTGEPGKGKFLCSSPHGPYDYLEMIQEVGMMWAEHQHHACAILLTKNNKERVKVLDARTIDYIEAQWENIIAESILEDALAEPPAFTHTAGFSDVTFDAAANPQLQEKKDLSKDDKEEDFI